MDFFPRRVGRVVRIKFTEKEKVMSLSRFTLFVLAVIAPNTAVIANDNAKAFALLRGVVTERLKYVSFHIRYEEHRAEEGQTSVQVVDFDNGKIRKEHRPGRGFMGMKSILLEDYMYYMPVHNGNHIAIVSLQSVQASGSGTYDPRMLGLSDMLSHHMDAAMLYKNRSNFSVSREYLNGRSVYVVEHQDGEENGFAHWKFYIEEPGFFLVRIVMESRASRIQIDNDYSNRNFLPFPTEIRARRVRKEGQREIVAFDRRITVQDVQIRDSFPPETFTLAALRPPLNSDIVDYRINRRLGYWDGEKIVDDPVSMSAQEYRALTAGNSRQPLSLAMRLILMGIGIAMVLYALYSMYRKRSSIQN
jgi:hypothetical protein